MESRQLVLEMDRKFEDINKFIFVKEYEKAFLMLEDLLSQEDAKKNTLFQLRRVELGLKIRDIEWFRDLYRQSILSDQISEECGRICLALAEMFSNASTGQKLVEEFTRIISEFGESPGAYFGLAFSFESMGNFDRAIFNYKQSLKKDPSWYPSYFGLSQAFYQQDDSENGDHYFHLFEKFAPFNLYGNFETHKRLSDDFLHRSCYKEAEIAIRLLSEWWSENRGFCPTEVKVYEHLMRANIAKKQNNQKKRENSESKIDKILDELEKQNDTDKIGAESLYFMARAFEEFSDFDRAILLYQRILRHPKENKIFIEKISQHLLDQGKAKQAGDLFEEAYRYNPNNVNIRFCRLACQLKHEGVDVSNYLESKEQIRKLSQHEYNHLELLAALQDLYAQFQKDPDIHANLAEVYQSLHDEERAAKHYSMMYELDPENQLTTLKYASFCAEKKVGFNANDILLLTNSLHFDPIARPSEYCEASWLKARVVAQDPSRLREAIQILQACQNLDPWNILYLAAEISWKIELRYEQDEVETEPLLTTILRSEDASQGWDSFRKTTNYFVKKQDYELAYIRAKLDFLYTAGEQESCENLIRYGALFDPDKAGKDLTRLLNTNFDHPQIYFGLGKLSQEAGQLEVAKMWFEQLLSIPGLSCQLKTKACMELADCCLWLNKSLQKGIGYIKVLEEDPHVKGDSRLYVILLHGYLKSGQISQAKKILEKIPEPGTCLESDYLRGLLHYRNGLVARARRIWKPLLTYKSQNLKSHYIKQELMKYYFDGDSYLKVCGV